MKTSNFPHLGLSGAPLTEQVYPVPSVGGLPMLVEVTVCVRERGRYIRTYIQTNTCMYYILINKLNLYSSLCFKSSNFSRPSV